jgi:hypothetical protein
MNNRRVFMLQCSVGGLLFADPAFSQGALVAETDAQATALGYKSDAAKVDKSKYPKFAAGQHCGVCAFYQGKTNDASGACPLFAGKQVSSKGWCSAWAKKA